MNNLRSIGIAVVNRATSEANSAVRARATTSAGVAACRRNTEAEVAWRTTGAVIT